ncbi:MAG: exopolysaccharide biosynthesis protein [Alphaproteobacteria bacterium]
MAQFQTSSAANVPTSAHLARLLAHADGDRVAVSWLMEQLGERSFGLTLFLLALLCFVPGVATISSVLIAWPAIQMILGHDGAVLPKFVARREIRVDKLARAIRFVAPKLVWVERLIRPRWSTPFQSTKRLTGLATLSLGLIMILPVPLGQLLPALAVMLLALAYLEKDGVCLAVALVFALVSIAATTATVWGMIETIDWLDPATLQP